MNPSAGERSVRSVGTAAAPGGLPQGRPVSESRESDLDGDDQQARADYAATLERATRGLLELNVTVLERMERKIGLAPLRALQALENLGPCLVTELGNHLQLRSSTASRLSDRLAEAHYITRSVAPTNRRATLLELTDTGQAILDELVATRTAALETITRRLSETDRAALLHSTQAFTTAYQHHDDPRG